MTDHYKVLGLERGASAGDIKSAWRRAAKWHPDVCQEPDAAAKFRAAAEAYEVLGDPEKRAAHDLALAGPRPAPSGVGSAMRVDFECNERLTWFGGTLRVLADVAGRRMSLEVKVPPGARVGDSWRFPGQGMPGTPPGDLLVVLQGLRPDHEWTAVGPDLHGRARVRLSDVYEGSSVIVQGPRGVLRVRLPRCQTTPLRVRGEGRTIGGVRGDLVLELDLVWPREDSRIAAVLRAFS